MAALTVVIGDVNSTPYIPVCCQNKESKGSRGSYGTTNGAAWSTGIVFILVPFLCSKGCYPLILLRDRQVRTPGHTFFSGQFYSPPPASIPRSQPSLPFLPGDACNVITVPLLSFGLKITTKPLRIRQILTLQRRL